MALVGAGPGHPELLTLRGQKWLSRCDVVLYDGLSNVDMLVHAPHAKHICVGKHGQTRIWKQHEIIDEILRHAAQGKCVVRLKGGDPAVFARTSEEIDALVAAKIPFEIVPGITAALAAGSYAGIPITHRGIASAVALVTGHEEPGKSESALDWSVLAAFPGTLVVYMGVTTAEAWTGALMDAGKPVDTPCAILRRCSLPDQQQIRCRLDEVVGHLTPASQFRPPVITIVGDVTRISETVDWFSKRPLHGQRVLVTRPSGQAGELAGPLEDLGAEVIRHSVIEILPPEDWTEVDVAQDELSTFDWIVFASANGVASFLDRLDHRGKDSRAMGGCRIAVVGKATAKRLEEYRLRVDYVPPKFTAESLLKHFTEEKIEEETEVRMPRSSQRFLIVRADRGSDTLPRGLRAAGAEVREVIGYRNVDVHEVAPSVDALARDGAIDWVIVTSSATAVNLNRLFGDTISRCRFAAISPVTANVLKNLGYRVDAVADPHTMQGIITAIRHAMKSG